jgi:hypothetical protein
MPLKPRIAVRKKAEVLERRKVMIDALIKFMKKHPKITCDASVKGLEGGKNGLSFHDYALIVPYWNDGDIELRLVKSGEDWMNNLDSDAYQRLERLASDDVSDLTDAELEKLLDGMYREANPDAGDEDESDS